MGQIQGGYLDALNWDDRLTLEQRMDRGPFQVAFGLGRGDAAADAVERARRDHLIAENVFDQVKEQAVYALLAEGLTIRAIAKKIAVPKSEVGRIARRLGPVDDHTRSHATASPFGNEVRDRVRAAWGHR